MGNMSIELPVRKNPQDIEIAGALRKVTNQTRPRASKTPSVVVKVDSESEDNMPLMSLRTATAVAHTPVTPTKSNLTKASKVQKSKRRKSVTPKSNKSNAPNQTNEPVEDGDEAGEAARVLAKQKEFQMPDPPF
ncbi:hypothetical protein MCOR09_002507 [Pyricularia oryzae]|nr:hypothetical protein MCOR09_002507 [Pyricularia oryzae]